MPLLAERVTTLEYEALVWDDGQWERFALALRHCQRLHTLKIKRMLQGSGAAGLRKALGEVRALTRLDLNKDHQLGDEGCAGLCAAARRGALPALEALDLESNGQFGDGRCGASAAAVARGWLPALETVIGSCGTRGAELMALRLLQDSKRQWVKLEGLREWVREGGGAAYEEAAHERGSSSASRRARCSASARRRRGG